jgi:hypothetical protein
LLAYGGRFSTISEAFFASLIFFERGFMTSKERMRAAIRGELPDTAPVNFYTFREWADSWKTEDPSYSRIIAFARDNCDSYLPYGQRPLNEKAFLTSTDRISVERKEWREGENTFVKTIIQTPKGPLTNLFRIIDKIDTSWQIEHFVKSEEDVERFLSIPYEPVDYDVSDFSEQERRIGDRGILFPGLIEPAFMAASLFSFADFTVWAMTRRDEFTKLIEIFWERARDYNAHALENMSGCHFRLCGPEYFTPPYLPGELFRKYELPYLKKIMEAAHEKGCTVQLHMHGKVGTLLDEILEIGPDAFDPLEPPPDGDIELGEVKKRIGARICLCGNLEMRDFEISTVDEIDRKVKAIMADAKEGGRLIMMPTATPITSPLPQKVEANMMQFVESGRRYGRY